MALSGLHTLFLIQINHERVTMATQQGFYVSLLRCGATAVEKGLEFLFFIFA